jgi:hypothetical protein
VTGDRGTASRKTKGGRRKEERALSLFSSWRCLRDLGVCLEFRSLGGLGELFSSFAALASFAVKLFFSLASFAALAVKL